MSEENASELEAIKTTAYHILNSPLEDNEAAQNSATECAREYLTGKLGKDQANTVIDELLQQIKNEELAAVRHWIRGTDQIAIQEYKATARNIMDTVPDNNEAACDDAKTAAQEYLTGKLGEDEARKIIKEISSEIRQEALDRLGIRITTGQGFSR